MPADLLQQCPETRQQLFHGLGRSGLSLQHLRKGKADIRGRLRIHLADRLPSSGGFCCLISSEMPENRQQTMNKKTGDIGWTLFFFLFLFFFTYLWLVGMVVYLRWMVRTKAGAYQPICLL